METGPLEELQDGHVDDGRWNHSITPQHVGHAHSVHLLDHAGFTKVRAFLSDCILSLSATMLLYENQYHHLISGYWGGGETFMHRTANILMTIMLISH